MSADPQIRDMEKRIATEARADKHNLDHAIKDLQNSEKTYQKAIKSADKAQHGVDKAVKNEHKAAAAVEKAKHNHKDAIAAEQSAEKALELKRQHEARLEKDLQQRRATVEDWEHRKDTNDQQREMKLSDIHAAAADRAGSRANSINRGPMSGATNPGAATGVEKAEGPIAPGAGPAGADTA